MLSPPGTKPEAKAPKDPTAPKEPRKRRKSSVYDADGHEVLITMMCLKCRSMKPLTMFGLRKMADGAIRNQPWCRTCRSGAGTGKKKGTEAVVEASPQAAQVVAATPAGSAAPVETAAAEHEHEHEHEHEAGEDTETAAATEPAPL